MRTLKTAEANRGTIRERPRLLLRGVDSLYVSYFFNLRRAKIDFDELSYQKERVKAARNTDFAEIELGSERFALMPYGKHPYRYVLSNEAFEVRLAERISPTCHVQFFSERLWHDGVQKLTERLKAWAASVELSSALPEVIARADWAFDYALPAIDFGIDDFVHRSKEDKTNRAHRVVQTFTFGRGRLVLRVYDKVAEIKEESGKTWFFDLWGQREGVWRVEFQARRARLKEAGIHTLDDLQARQGDLLQEVARNHTTLRRPNGDSNPTRWPLHSLWIALQDDVAKLERTGPVHEFNRTALYDLRLWHQGRSIYGFLKGLGALLSERDNDGSPLTFDDVLNALPRVVGAHHNGMVWPLDLEKRIAGLRLGQW